MNSHSQPDIQEQLAALRAAYAAQLPAKIDDIETYWQNLRNGSSRSDTEVLHRLTHSLAGSGSTFGFPKLSGIARSIEQRLKAWLEQDGSPTEAQWSDVAALISELRFAAVAPDSKQVPAAIRPETVVAEVPATSDHPLIYLIEDDRTLADELALQLDHFGYRVKVFHTTHGVAAAVADQRPDAFVTDINLPCGPMAGVQLLADLQKQHGPDLPVIFMSSRNDFSARLAAARAGGVAYFVKPLDIAPLVDRLDQLTRRGESKPYRILAVDDDAALAAHYELVLRQAGMHVRTETRPEHVIQAIVESKPELILMDVYMPTCSGLELAKLIRQQEAYLGIPIVFLSSESNLEKQFSAMRMGGDDFLTKPVPDEHLVSSVSVRAERARVLSSLMVQDSLTGLLKHTMIKEQLASELSRAKRTGSDLTFAMIDIDHFKGVNDHYGHMSGDRVIKSLSRLLQQRLRKSDSIGRYGGEEFAVVLPNCDAIAAARLIDAIRDDFAAIHYQHGGCEFSVTFSAGLASFPLFGNAEDINQAADEALYGAKNRGRNCVVVAQASDTLAPVTVGTGFQAAGHQISPASDKK